MDRYQIELTDLKTAFDAADETGDGVITLNDVINILQQFEIEDITSEQIEKEFQNKSDKSDAILFNVYLEIMSKLGLRQEEKNSQIANPISFCGGDQLFYAHKNNFKMQTIDKEYNEIQRIQNKVKYGYSLDCQDNIKIMNEYPEEFEDAKFSQDIWYWINECQHNQKFLDGSLNQICEENDYSEVAYQYFGHEIYESEKRNKCLQNLGWSGSVNIGLDKSKRYLETLQKHESNKNNLRAAMISVFHFDFSRAYYYVSKAQDKTEGITFLKSILQGLKNIQEYLQEDEEIYTQFYKQMGDELLMEDDFGQSQNKSRNKNVGTKRQVDLFADNPNLSDLRNISSPVIRSMMIKNFLNFTKRLCKDAQYTSSMIKCICQFISNENYMAILEDLDIPIIEKIAYALRFSNQETLVNFLKKQRDNSIKNGILDGLIFFSSQDEKSIEIIQNYINITNDIQTAGLISLNLKFLNYIKRNKLEQFFETYKDLLNKLQLYEARNMIDKQLLELEKVYPELKSSAEEEINVSQIHQCCSKCNYILTHSHQMKQLSRGQMRPNFNILNASKQASIKRCPNCGNSLPTCSICILPLNIPNPHLYFNNNKKQSKVEQNDITPSLDDAIVWCQRCNHGGHFNHIFEWFQNYSVCPVQQCHCECAML